MFDLSSKENAIAAGASGLLAIIFGLIAVITNVMVFAGVAIGTGVWSVVYGITALVKKQ